MLFGTIFGSVVGIIGAGFGIYFALYAVGFFNYLGGKKSNPNAVSKQELIDQLLSLNDESKPYRIIRGEDTDLVAEWKIVDAKWYGIFSKSGLKKAYKARLLLDETRHSVRCCEELGNVTWSAGTNGLIPHVHYRKTFFRGRILYKKEWARGYGIGELNPLEVGKIYDYKFDVNEIRGPIMVTVEDSGWEWVPVTALRHATY